jgi:NDP-sugar pyrophosphorylase family protein
VTPTSTGGTLYSVDFGDPAAANDEDFFLIQGLFFWSVEIIFALHFHCTGV